MMWWDTFKGWLRSPIGSFIWLVVRVYIGFEWMMAGWAKLSGAEPGFFTSTKGIDGFLQHALSMTGGEHPAVQGWYAALIQHVFLPLDGVLSVAIPLGEFLAGLGLILGCFTTVALLGTLAMNFAYLLAGTLSTNPQLAILEMILLGVGSMAVSRYGLDRWVMPVVNEKLHVTAAWRRPKPTDAHKGPQHKVA